MTEYIKREDALRAVKRAWAKGIEPSEYIEDIEAADVAPVKHGQWKQVSKANRAVKCTACGFTTDSARARMYRYCPDCGAKMDGGKDDA